MTIYMQNWEISKKLMIYSHFIEGHFGSSRSFFPFEATASNHEYYHSSQNCCGPNDCIISTVLFKFEYVIPMIFVLLDDNYWERVKLQKWMQL